MKQLICIISLLLLAVPSLITCDEQESNSTQEDQTTPIPGQTRTFALGFTDFPYARTAEAYLEGYGVIETNADMAVMHFDDGIPWQDAWEEKAYDDQMVSDLRGKVSLIPEGHLIYLATTPISFERDDIAKHKGGDDTPWRTRLDDPDVVSAYLNHAKRMIDLFSPDYFAYAIEVNLFYHKAPDRWNEFVSLATATYTTVKSEYPDLPVFVTIQADFFHLDPQAQTAAIEQILPYTDYIATSTYPYVNQSDPSLPPANHFTAILDLSPQKPFSHCRNSMAGRGHR